jgi:hypothetical protein
VRGYGSSAKYSTVSYSGVIEISFIILVLVLEKREPGGRFWHTYLDFGLNGVLQSVTGSEFHLTMVIR